MKFDKIEYERLQGMTTEQLEIYLGSLIIGEEKMLLFPSKEDFLEQCKDWFDRHNYELKKRICTSDKIYSFSKNTSEISDINVFSAVFDLVCSIKTGIAGMAVTVLIMRYGFSAFCEKYWDENF